MTGPEHEIKKIDNSAYLRTQNRQIKNDAIFFQKVNAENYSIALNIRQTEKYFLILVVFQLLWVLLLK